MNKSPAQAQAPSSGLSHSPDDDHRVSHGYHDAGTMPQTQARTRTWNPIGSCPASLSADSDRDNRYYLPLAENKFASASDCDFPTAA